MYVKQALCEPAATNAMWKRKLESSCKDIQCFYDTSKMQENVMSEKRNQNSGSCSSNTTFRN
jgi:hypothetical protein